MGQLIAFNFITLNGFFEGPGKGDISWHLHGGEENEYSVVSLKAGNVLLFGRLTYEMMASYWPTQDALNQNPRVAEAMNLSEKIVFSRTIQQPVWANTIVLKENMTEEVSKRKQSSGKDLTILGSGSIINQCTDAGLIDEYQIMIDPFALGSGTPIFRGIKKKLDLKLVECKTFKSGIILLRFHKRA